MASGLAQRSSAEHAQSVWLSREYEKHFCRASFSVKEGSRPVHHVFGEPPFVGEGFTVPEEDGYVALFFNRGGAPLDDLRRQAFAATQ